MKPLLEVEAVSKAFGGLIALDRVTMSVRAGEIRALIGPNGAGKTTLVNVITGVYRPTAGSVRLEGRELVGLLPHRVATRGIARTFQTVRLFPELSVLDNVRVAHGGGASFGVLAAILRTRGMKREEAEARARALEILRDVGLEERAELVARHLPYGQQRLTEVARALATRPRLLLLDEPVAGLNAREAEGLGDLIRRLRDTGLTILLIEHNMRFVTGIAESVTVLEFGRCIADGPVREVMEDPTVIAAYLGEENSRVAS